MMKIKTNGKIILVSLLVLILFSTLVIWHDKPSSRISLQEKKEIVQKLSLRNSDLKKFIGQRSDKETLSFYSIGMPGKYPWPRDLKRACYPDPLAARWQFSDISNAYAHGIEVIRYRSLGDFLALLLEAERESPGIIALLDFNSHVLTKEDVLNVSYRSIIAIVIGFIGLIVVGLVRPKT